MTLLDKAKLYRRKERCETRSADELELAVAWLAGEVSFSAVRIALKKTASSATYGWLALASREAYHQGKIGKTIGGAK